MSRILSRASLGLGIGQARHLWVSVSSCSLNRLLFSLCLQVITAALIMTMGTSHPIRLMLLSTISRAAGSPFPGRQECALFMQLSWPENLKQQKHGKLSLPCAHTEEQSFESSLKKREKLCSACSWPKNSFNQTI